MTCEERANALENLICRYIENYREEYEYGEALRRLLKMLIEHDVEIPEALQTWAFQVAIDPGSNLSRGRKKVGKLDDRIYDAFRYLMQDKQCSSTKAYEIIANLGSKSLRPCDHQFEEQPKI